MATCRLLALLVMSNLSLHVQAQSLTSITSPNRALSLDVRLSAAGELTYQLSYQRKPVVLPSLLGFAPGKPALSLTRFRLLAADSTTVDEQWKPVWGETSRIRNHYRE